MKEAVFMSRNKTSKLKERLGKKIKQNRRVPVFIVPKTNRRVSQNNKRRNWRSSSLKLKD